MWIYLSKIGNGQQNLQLENRKDKDRALLRSNAVLHGEILEVHVSAKPRYVNPKLMTSVFHTLL